MIRPLSAYGADLYRLFFPRLCGACDGALLTGETHLCLHCRLGLPATRFELLRNNPVERIFYGRVPLDFATAFLFFSRADSVQRILHQVKYNNRRELAVFMGNLFAERIRAAPWLHDADLLIPVPLHPRKLAQRGYNQSELIASGMAKNLGLTLEAQALQRTVHTDTQTRKSRIERWENVGDVFRVADPARIRQRHIVLVDDVLTTGATLEACAQALLRAADCRVSVAALAYAG